MFHTTRTARHMGTPMFVALITLSLAWVASAITDSAPLLPPTDNDASHISLILAPRHEAVLSSEVTARVTSLARELGQSFDNGQLLIQLDDTIYRAGLSAARADLHAATTNLETLQKQQRDKTRQRQADAILAAAAAGAQTAEKLFADGHTSQLDLENARRDLIMAQTGRELVDAKLAEEMTLAQRELISTQTRLTLAEQQLKACRIIGPYAGRVARLFINAHELAKPGTPLVRIIDDRVLLAKMLLPSRLFRTLALGRVIQIHVTEADILVHAKISHIAAELDPASTTFEVHAEIDNASAQLRAGMNATLDLAIFDASTTQPASEVSP